MKKCLKQHDCGNDMKNHFVNEVDSVMKSMDTHLFISSDELVCFLEHMKSIIMTWNEKSNFSCERTVLIHGHGIKSTLFLFFLVSDPFSLFAFF